jgi:hypothetical protein
MSIDIEKITFEYFTKRNEYNKYLENKEKKDEHVEYFDYIKANKDNIKEEMNNIIDNICENEIDYQSLNAIKKLYERDKKLNCKSDELLNSLEIIKNDKKIFKKNDDFWKK